MFVKYEVSVCVSVFVCVYVCVCVCSRLCVNVYVHVCVRICGWKRTYRLFEWKLDRFNWSDILDVLGCDSLWVHSHHVGVRCLVIRLENQERWYTAVLFYCSLFALSFASMMVCASTGNHSSRFGSPLCSPWPIQNNNSYQLNSYQLNPILVLLLMYVKPNKY